MNEALATSLSQADRRRTTRVAKRVPITVTGVDALGKQFRDITQTVEVSCHGCKYTSKHYVPKQSTVTIEIPCAGFPLHIISGRVVWVQRPRSVNEEFEIALEFKVPRNVWEIVPAPADWQPFCDEQTATVPPSVATTVPEMKALTSGISSASTSTPADGIERIETTMSYDTTSLLAESRDAQIQETIERTVAESMPRIVESAVEKILQQVGGPLAAAIAETVCQEIKRTLNAQIENTVLGAVRQIRSKPIRSRAKPRKKVAVDTPMSETFDAG